MEHIYIYIYMYMYIHTCICITYLFSLTCHGREAAESRGILQTLPEGALGVSSRARQHIAAVVAPGTLCRYGHTDSDIQDFLIFGGLGGLGGGVKSLPGPPPGPPGQPATLIFNSAVWGTARGPRK